MEMMLQGENDLLANVKTKKINFIVGNSETLLYSLIDNWKIIEGENYRVGVLNRNFVDYFFCNTVYEEILFILKKNRVKNYYKKIMEVLKIVYLDESILKKSPFEISKGEQKKLALAKILVCNPKVLILYEPFLNLDSSSRSGLIKLFRRMKLRYGKTIIIVSNNTDIALELADIILYFKNGEIVVEDNKFDFFTNEELLKRCRLSVPKLIRFSNLVKDIKNINIGYRTEINDLMKDIYRFVK